VIELVPQTYFASLDLLAIFGRVAPLDVDLGCGNGDLLSELARRKPDRNFLGVEKMASRVAKACRKAAALENVRVLNVESLYAVRHLLPENCVETFYLLFPDPWPKRRHQRRRIVQPAFLDSIHRALAPHGIFRIATDQADYFKQIERLALNDPRFEKVQHSSVDSLPVTKFERRFRAAGAPIYWLALRKVLPVT
jgi:tRNA (guanine-N7-)-methyltransferase